MLFTNIYILFIYIILPKDYNLYSFWYCQEVERQNLNPLMTTQ